jgi:hypothetical protein
MLATLAAAQPCEVWGMKRKTCHVVSLGVAGPGEAVFMDARVKCEQWPLQRIWQGGSMEEWMIVLMLLSGCLQGTGTVFTHWPYGLFP